MADKDLELIQQRIGKFRTQQAAANAIGVSRGYINNIFHGRKHAPDAVLSALGLERIVTSRIRPKRVAK